MAPLRIYSLFTSVAVLMALASPAAAGGVQVDIEGLPSDQSAGVRSVLSIAELADEDDVQRSAVRRAHLRAEGEIRAALEI